MEIKGQCKSGTIKNAEAKGSPGAKSYLRSNVCLFFSFFREPERWERSKWGARNIRWDDASDWAEGPTCGFLRGTAHQRKGWRPALWKLHILQGLSAEQDVSRALPLGASQGPDPAPHTSHTPASCGSICQTCDLSYTVRQYVFKNWNSLTCYSCPRSFQRL